MNYTLAQRNADFMSAVRHATAAWSGKEEPTVTCIIRKVINNGAPGFYVKYETAYRFVCLVLRNRLPLNINGVRRRQWDEIADRVRKTMTDHPDYSIGQALVEVIDAGNAPSFYLSFASAKSLYYRLLSHRRPISSRTLRRNRNWE